MITTVGSSSAAASSAAFGSLELKAAGAVVAAGTTTGTGQVVTGGARSAEIQCKLTAAATEAGDTLDVYVDTSYDGGTTWVNVLHFPQMLGNGGAKTFVGHIGTTNPAAAPIDCTSDAAVNVVRNLGLGDRIRVRYVVVDVATLANISFNFSVFALLKS